MSYEFHPAAEAEYLESIAYYESKRPGLGALYMVEFESILNQVCETPHRYPIEQKPDIRRIRMKKFPYTIFYREYSDGIQVLGVAHYRRRPLYWLGRSKENFSQGES